MEFVKLYGKNSFDSENFLSEKPILLSSKPLVNERLLEGSRMSNKRKIQSPLRIY